MANESRVKKSLLNAKVNLICYFVSLLVAFFTRKIFLDQLGTEFIGFTGTLQSLLGFLNLAELGIGSAIGYVLYKPIFDDDHNKINEIISVFGYLYRCIGLFILGAGILLSCFLLLIFPETTLSWGVIYFGFYAYLATSMLGYFVNYKQTLLSADQRNYVVTGYFQAATTVKVIIQAVLALTFNSFYLYLALELVFGIINSILLQWRINITYPWLQSEVRLGRKLFKKYPEIGTYIKQLFVHKIGAFVQFQLSPFLVYAYVSLPMVALYGNYTLVTQRIQSFLNAILNSTGAGVGNLISEGNKQQIWRVYRELLSFRVFIAGFCAVSIFVLIGGFISVWLGEEYELPHLVAFLICVQFFMAIVREVTDQFIFGYGLFYDVWAPLVESAIFIIASIVFGALYGLPGVLAGPLLSTFIIIYLWKPYFLFSKGFHYPVYRFWLLMGHNMIALLIATVATFLLYRLCIEAVSLHGWALWIVQSVIFSTIMGVCSLISFYSLNSDFRSFASRFVKKSR